MTERTEKSLFLVHEQGESVWNGKTTKTRLWFEVLHGGDAGIRVSIPLYHESYSEEMREQLATLSQGDVVEAVLERDGPSESWTPLELERV